MKRKINTDLPEEIMSKVDELWVERLGPNEDSHMCTLAISDFAIPGRPYCMTKDNLVAASSSDIEIAQMNSSPATDIPSILIPGKWVKADQNTKGNPANILGGDGRFNSTLVGIEIPVADTNGENLAYYGAILCNEGSAVIFDTDAPLPVTLMEIGERYAYDYLQDSDLGGGVYIEYHDRPHFHMPIDKHAGGYLLLGKFETGGIRISAFRIAYGQGILTPGGVLHNDAFLYGRYRVIYSVTPNFSTVILHGPAGELQQVKIHSSE